MKYLGSCIAAIERFDAPDEHCPSCHTEEAEGYSSLSEVFADKDGLASPSKATGWYEVCCEVARAITGH